MNIVMKLMMMVLTLWSVYDVANAYAPQSVNAEYSNLGKMTYMQGFYLCKKLGLRMVTVKNEKENNQLNEKAKADGSTSYWIDVNAMKEAGKFVGDRNQPIKWSKWGPGEPNNQDNNEDCVLVYTYTNLWNNVDCNAFVPVYCTKENKDDLMIVERQVTYFQAVLLCKKIGYTLLRIVNETANTYAYEWAVMHQAGVYWIDGNDRAKEGTFVDNDGTALKYLKWSPGEPNNYGGLQDCIEANNYGNSKWDDIACLKKNTAICMKPCT